MNDGDPEQIEKAIDWLAMLQEVDQRLRTRRLDANALDEEIRVREDALRAQRQEVESLRAQRLELEARRKELERQLDDEGVHMKDRRMRLNRVRTEKELQAIRREIELGKEANQQMETEILACMEQLEINAQALQVSEAALEALESPATQEISERRGRLTALEEGSAEDERRRADLAGKLDAALRAKYEQIFERRGGLAVVEVRNGTCHGCHMHVPPQLFNEIQRTREVRLCPNCHRILFWRPEAPEGTAAQGR
jgi:hypothetical protein